ncbi:hypothetical protein V6N13_142190 [Hibiscus sabdariffa]|uniref:Uncharacterized protein n=1 Tax=Hibiscus sabdariffa TaxID=183260 RepID=A0ABR2FDJ6_9ROSI
MARDFLDSLGGNDPREQVGGLTLHSSTGLLLLSMIVFSLSIISMIVFGCGDDNSGNSGRCTGGPSGCGTNCGAGCGG